MDSFLWLIPEFDRKVDINKSDGSQPEVIGKSADFKPEPEKIKAKQKSTYHDKQDRIPEKRNIPVRFYKIANRSRYRDNQKDG